MARLNLPHVQHGVPAPHAENLHQRVDTLLETFLDHTRRALRDRAGRKRAQKLARSYLQTRGVDLECLDRLPIGLVVDPEEIEKALRSAGFRPEEIEASKLIADARLPGRLVGPIQDSSGHILSFWARHLEDLSPRYLFKGKWQNEVGAFGLHVALPALKQSDGNLVLVSDLLDALLLSHQGFSPVVAIGGPVREMTAIRWQRLAEQGVRQVTLVLGSRRAEEILEALEAAFLAVRAPRVFVCVSERLREAESISDWCHEHGLDALGGLLEYRIHAYHFKALALLDDYRPDGPWNDAARFAALDAAHAFYESQSREDTIGDLNRHFVPPILEELRLTWDATPPVDEPDWEDVPEEDEHDVLIEAPPLVDSHQQDGPADDIDPPVVDEPVRFDEPDDLEAELPCVLAEELPEHRDYLRHQQARRFRGLRQHTLPNLDRLTSGLRGLILLYGPAGGAKTALSLQLGIDAVRHNPQACLLFVSPTVFRWELLTRLKSRLARLSGHALLKACSRKNRRLSSRQQQRLERAERELADWGRRVLILDRENAPDLSVQRVREAWYRFKSETGSRRGVIVIDGLDRLPECDSRNGSATRESLLALFEEELVGDAIVATTSPDLPAPAAGTVLPCSQLPHPHLLELSDPANPELFLRGWTAAELAALFTGHSVADISLEDERRWRGELARHGWLLYKLQISDPRQPGLVAELDLPLHYSTWSFREGLSGGRFSALADWERKLSPVDETPNRAQPLPTSNGQTDRAPPRAPAPTPPHCVRRHVPGECMLHHCDNLQCFCFD